MLELKKCNKMLQVATLETTSGERFVREPAAKRSSGKTPRRGMLQASRDGIRRSETAGAAANIADGFDFIFIAYGAEITHVDVRLSDG